MNGLRLTLFSMLLIGISSLHPSRLLAQSGTTSRHGHSLTCASDDGKLHTCKADTSRGVILVNQRSGSPCIEGQSWGYNNKGIWVDKGCRADFALLGKNASVNPGQGEGGQGYEGATITCSSDNGGRKYCNANTSRGVRLIEQKSGSPCIEGQTWGFTGNSIWVDRGCRATFAIGNGNGYDLSGSSSTITCSSDSGGRKYCNANTSGGVRLIEQKSGSPCIEGQTWGFTGNSIWVDRGCRATFAIGNGGGYSAPGSSSTITCSSDNGGRKYCNANTSRGVRLVRQISGSACVEGQSWGYDSGGIWVNHGCRATFTTGRR